MEHKTSGDEQERERLTRRANKVRSRLLADVDTLDARRHALSESIGEISRSTKKLLPVIAVGAAGAAAVGLAVWALGRRRRELTLMPFAHVDIGPHQKGTTRKLVEKLAGTLALAIARRLAARAVERWVQGPALPAHEGQ